MQKVRSLIPGSLS